MKLSRWECRVVDGDGVVGRRALNSGGNPVMRLSLKFREVKRDSPQGILGTVHHFLDKCLYVWLHIGTIVSFR
jgi:hypothetical protein